MILISITLMLKAKAKPVNKAHKGMIRTYEDESGELYTYSYRIFTGIVIAFFVGLLGGLFGIGGGSLMVPAMMLLFCSRRKWLWRRQCSLFSYPP